MVPILALLSRMYLDSKKKLFLISSKLSIAVVVQVLEKKYVARKTFH